MNLIVIRDQNIFWAFNNFIEAAEIYKRKDWNATDLDKEQDYLTRRISTKVIVATTGDDGCVEYVSFVGIWNT